MGIKSAAVYRFLTRLIPVIILICSVQFINPAAALALNVERGDMALEFSARKAEGGMIKLSDYRGKTVFLTF